MASKKKASAQRPSRTMKSTYRFLFSPMCRWQTARRVIHVCFRNPSSAKYSIIIYQELFTALSTSLQPQCLSLVYEPISSHRRQYRPRRHPACPRALRCDLFTYYSVTAALLGFAYAKVCQIDLSWGVSKFYFLQTKALFFYTLISNIIGRRD